MIKATMPIDTNGNAIPALALRRGGGAHTIPFNTTSARNAVAFDSQLCSLYATQPCYIEFGGPTVVATASSHFYPGGVLYDMDLHDGNTLATHIAVLRTTADGTLYVSEKS